MIQKSVLLIFAMCFTLSIQSQTDSKIYSSSELDDMPVFAQGKMTLNDFLKFYQKQPEGTSNKSMRGTVQLSLIISSEGEVLNSSISKGLDAPFDKEALRLADMMPLFSPAKVNGQAVASKIKLGIPFGETDMPVTNMQAAPIAQNSTDNSLSKVSKTPVKKYPLYVIDGKVVNEDINVNADNIESVRVLKGKKAIEKYGERAIDGVVIFTTKNFPNR